MSIVQLRQKIVRLEQKLYVFIGKKIIKTGQIREVQFELTQVVISLTRQLEDGELTFEDLSQSLTHIARYYGETLSFLVFKRNYFKFRQRKCERLLSRAYRQLLSLEVRRSH